jgi:hypothetical protein
MDRCAKALSFVSESGTDSRELGLNPAKLGWIDNRKQERSNPPLPRSIEQLCFQCFSKTTPENEVATEKS